MGPLLVGLLLVRAAGVYVLFAVIGRFVEGMGAVRCDCAPGGWCKRLVLSTFRWVVPVGHRLQGVAAEGEPPSATTPSATTS